nr:MAG TPA: putative transcriptional regulator [Caudoviricetes sp.]
MAMKENTRKVFDYLKDNTDKDLTAADVAEALDLEKRQVDGIFTSALQRKNLGIREVGEIELADGSHQKVKYLRLTEDGMAFDPDAQE